ncbi:MAG: flagellar hook-associated protein FlgK [Clostridiales bacterium]|nr:flagellar hook-associated protein FlgK [Clostridiales bacterium]
MGISFNSLEIAKTGLFVSRRALDITGHNIANADTVGYTRQRLVTQSLDPYGQNGRFLQVNNDSVGRGVSSLILDQIRSSYIDREYRHQNSDAGLWSTRTEEMEYIETLLNESSDTSISKSLADFFDSINELSKDAISEEIRTNVQQNAVKLTETVNHYYNKFVDLQNVYNNSMEVTTQNINDYLTNITAYNKQIFSYELSGEKANDLRDHRNVMLDELSELVNIEYLENSQGSLVVSVEGVELINHTTITKLEARPDLTGIVSGEPDFYEIYMEGTNTVFAYSSGELQAYKDLRDGNAVDNVGIPVILNDLNVLARSIAKEFNDVNNAGYTIPYGATLSQMGVDFFEVPSGDYSLLNAGNLRISDEVEESAYNIAASDQLVDMAAANNQRGNNRNALDMVALTTRTDIPVVAHFENYLKSLVVEVAIASSHSIKMNASQRSVVANLENRRQSISGVSLDEEMVDMVKHQHAYAAASRMINAVDEALDILINRTGMVGR